MQTSFSVADILNFEQRYRATFINSLTGFKSVALIGTANEVGHTNLAIFNSIFHLGANPPMFGFVVRPHSVERHTLDNILNTGQLTVNHIQEPFYQQAHQTSARYPAHQSEFDATGLTPVYHEGCVAPFVQESNIQIAAEFVRKIDVEENGTLIIVARITAVHLPEDCIATDGYIDVEQAGSITCVGLDSYHRTTRIGRLPYAKP
jgi:flavin reductase (DIM6/NTAB) family NADH-FMN oxidoreductase RutF